MLLLLIVLRIRQSGSDLLGYRNKILHSRRHYKTGLMTKNQFALYFIKIFKKSIARMPINVECSTGVDSWFE